MVIGQIVATRASTSGAGYGPTGPRHLQPAFGATRNNMPEEVHRSAQSRIGPPALTPSLPFDTLSSYALALLASEC
ncbi:MAG: hypothetical protein Kow0010_24270 [Dehalococcoidia bacterium]